MNKALQLAEQGMSRVSPNPLVGAIIVKNGSIVGEGYHSCFGEDHAEVRALRDAGQRAKGATMYVNLEPCATQWEGKKHPPCVDAILSAGIESLVIAHHDPNKHVSGKGIAKLRKSGASVRMDICKDAALRLNQAYLTNVCRNELFMHTKFAMSLDGKIGLVNGASQWISGSAARSEAHRMRAMHKAVMVGSGTIIQDNPQLTVRHVEGPDPLRVVLDKRFLTPVESRVIEQANDGNTMLCIAEDAAATHIEKITHCQNKGVQFLVVPQNDAATAQHFLTYVQKHLFSTGITSVLLEGGARTLATCISMGFWHRMSVFISPMVIGNGISPFQGITQEHLTMNDIPRYRARWKQYDDGIKVECYNPACSVDL